MYDQQTQKIRYNTDQQPHYITYNHLTFACNLTANGQQSFYEFNFDSSSEVFEFKLELANVKTRPTLKAGAPYVKPATRDAFEIQRKGRNGASINLVKPLMGPQDVELHFNVLDNEGEIYYKAVINVFVSEYDGVNF